MAKQFVNIGIEGNDGTGDSIRDAFNKVNENFTELYAVFGQGGQISFTSLSDTPSTLGANKIPVSNSAGNAITMRGITGTGIAVDLTSDPNNIKLSVTGTSVASDTAPGLGGPLDANSFAIANVGINQNAVNDFNTTHGTNITLDDVVITKGYADLNYLASSGGTGTLGEVRVRPEPANATDYSKTITQFANGDVNIPSHGFSSAANGLAFKYTTTGTAATNLTDNTVYFIRFVDSNHISLHATKSEATNNNDATRVKITVSGGSGTQTLIDNEYDSSLDGFYLSTEAIQRQSAVRRQGDKMAGPLFLSDHPGDLAGSGTPNAQDDLQAATKFYVDNTSYASTKNLFVSTNGDDSMSGVPADKYGRSLSYAYKTIAKACERAQILIDTSPIEPGPYQQTVTYNNGANNSTVSTAAVTTSFTAAQTALRAGMAANKQFITNEVIGYLNNTYPTYFYNVSRCKVDLGLIQDSIVTDVSNGLTANFHSIQSGKRYYSSNSGLKAINQQNTETLAAIAYAKTVTANVLNKTAPSQTYQGKFAVLSDGYTANTFTIFTGANNYVHTYVSGGTVTVGGTTVNVSTATYNNSSGIVTVTTSSPHGAVVGDIVTVANITWSCSLGNKIYPEVVSQDTSFSGTVDQSAKDSAAAKFDIITNIINNYNYNIAQTDGSTYTVTISNGGNGFVDQNATGNKDLVPGKVLRGKTSKALGLIVKVDQGATNDTVEMFLLEAKEFNVSEEVEFGNKVNTTQITIFVESGIYEEHLPIKVPANVSIKGDEFRRTIIRPKAGVSESVWAGVHFFRDTTFDGLTLASQNYGYHYLTDVTNSASAKKNNADMDVFLMNDATIIRNMTIQGHGGFAQVLDPEGQILTKSPYIQTGASFSRVENKKLFRGGMFVDGFVGNMEVTISNIVDAFTLDITSTAGQGLYIRKPQLPAPFYIAGIRYQVTAIKNYDQANGTAQILLASNSNSGNGYTGASPYNIIIQTGGNRSLLANDYTQVNDLGYGLVVTNGALSEQVSTFTYYCEASMFANNGGQIRSLNSSSANGNYGLKAQGSNPNELIDNITLADNMTQTGLIYNPGTTDFAQNTDATALYVFDTEYIPFNLGEVEIDHGGSIGIVRYEISNIETTNAPVQPATRSGTVYKINLSTAGANTTSSTGLKAAVADMQAVTIRNSRSFRFEDVNDVAPTRPSTAIVFDEYTDAIYRSIAFGNQDPIGGALGANEALITMDSPYDTVKMNVNMVEAQNNTYAGAGTTMGATVGDVVIAIDRITQATDVTRLNNGDMIFGWDGKVHRVTSYTDRTTYGTITIQDVNNIQPTPVGSGIHSSMYRASTSVNLRANLADNETGTLTVSISTMRATGHDFLDIGTGGFNTTNYPNVIYGDPQAPVQAYEVVEIGKGRVFYVSTDQDGFFRVGRFFTVDQGTGTVTFSASIALSNLDGIGFKRGVVVAEFSSDSAMTDNASDTVPTESAVRGYVNRRLHFDHQGQVVGNPIGAGAIARDGTTPATNSLSLGGFNINNLADPGADQDAATKSYVDAVNYATDEIRNNRDADFITPLAAGDLLMFNGKFIMYTTPANGGTFSSGQTITGSNSGATGTIIDFVQASIPVYGIATRITYTLTSGTNFNLSDTIDNGGGVTATVFDAAIPAIGNAVVQGSSDVTITADRDATATKLTFDIATGSIINADISTTAAIQQSKLAMNAATTRANSTGITQADLGLASFDSGDFTVTDGWVTLSATGVDYSDLPDLDQFQVIGRTTAGTGDATAVSFSSVVTDGGGIVDGDFGVEVSTAADPGEALIKTGAGTYGFSNVTKSREANSIVKTDADGQIDLAKLALNGNTAFDVDSSKVRLTTQGGVVAYEVIGSTVNNTVHSFIGNQFGFGGADASASTSNDAGSGVNTTPAIASDYIYAKTIEDGAKGTSFTGIVFGNTSTYIQPYDDSTEGKVGIVAGGTTTVIATPHGLIPGGAGGNASTNINMGDSSNRFNTMYATVFDGTATQAQYADLAEKFVADHNYQPGTVLMFGGPEEVTISIGENNRAVAGVVSQKPAYLMNNKLNSENSVELAMMGRVFCKVIGKIRKGDMLVTSKQNGVATSSEEPKLGTVIGKALQSYDRDEIGEIEIVVGKL